MSFLAFLGVASAIAYGLSSESRSASYKARKQALLEATNYNVNVRENFGDICYVCGVKKENSHTKLFGINCNDYPSIWPKNGWEKCIPLLEELPNLNDDDITDFINAYNQVRTKSLNELQKCFDEDYKSIQQNFQEKKDSNLNIFEKNHWNLIPIDKHREMANDIYYNTFWNKIATQPAKIIDKGFGTRKEIWQVKDYNKVTLNNYYSFCQDKCGYNDLML